MRTLIRIMFLFACFLSISVHAQEPLDVDTLNILAGGKVVASGYYGMPYFLYEGDFDSSSFRTRNGAMQDEAYIGILRNRRMTIHTIHVYGGTVSNDGGWFDSSESLPVIQVIENPGDDWKTVATIEDYPVLDGTDFDGAQAVQYTLFEITFDSPISCVGVRTAGKGSSGDDPTQSHIAIDEFRAFGVLGEAVATYDPPMMDGVLPIGTNFHFPDDNGSAAGDVMIDDIPETVARCEELEFFNFEAFFGFYTANPIAMNSVSFVHGPLSEDGGWFLTDLMDIRIDIKTEAGGEWQEAGFLEGYPDTTIDSYREDLPEDIETAVWTYTFNSPVEAIGVRFAGNGSDPSFAATPFAQCGEIWYEGKGVHAYIGPIGNGLDENGEPFKPDENGEIFIQAEWARSINDAYRILPHGDAKSGLVNRANWGPSFNQFSQQVIEFDFEIPEAGDYAIIAQHDTMSGWSDSYYVTFDDQDPMTPDTVTNDIRWVPTQGDPAGSPVTLERSWIITDIGVDVW
ncbi:MAG: hypothetical protein ACP5I1_18900, partial [Candidatus Hinthialibacter sp.]